MNKAGKDLLRNLAMTRALAEAKKYVTSLERDHGFCWRAVGDREGNFGNINIGSDPGNAFVERITNAIDAVIEREAVRNLKGKTRTIPPSPREAVQMWFGVKGGRLSNLPVQPRKDLPKGTVTRQELAQEVVIAIHEGSSKRLPTLEVRDAGIGLTAGQVPATILSLNLENKIDKPYLAGAYGQGGSTALAFSPEGCLIVTRRQPEFLPPGEDDHVAITFVRYNELDPHKNKNGRYEYLVLDNKDVGSIDASMLPDLSPGTTVVHFHMEIQQYSARMTQLTGSLWWLLQNALFDPVLPLWVEERRGTMLAKGQKADSRTISGNYTRLVDDKKDKVEHSDSVDVTVASTQDTVRVNYWVLRASPDDRGTPPVASYVDPYRPIPFTFNGQTHGTEERRFTAERLSLPYLAKSLVIHVELDNLSAQGRRQILSTTRDRLKQLPLFHELREAICKALSEDEELIRLDEERKESLLSKHSEAERAKMRERFAKLLERLAAGVDAKVAGASGDSPGRPKSTPTNRQPLEPLKTKSEPSFVKIANAQRPIPMRLGRHALVRLESDAPDGYLSSHVHANVTVGSDPETLVMFESRSDFKGGRSRMTVKLGDKASAGNSGTLTVFLLTAMNKTFSDKATVKVEAPQEPASTGRSGKAEVKAPDPIPVHEDEWRDHGWDETSVAKVAEDSKDVKIFVNMDNVHIRKLLRTGAYQETGVKRMSNNYLLYTAFYAWVKHVSERGKDIGVEGQQFEEYQRRELDRVAQTVVHSISAASRLDDEE